MMRFLPILLLGFGCCSQSVKVIDQTGSGAVVFGSTDTNEVLITLPQSPRAGQVLRETSPNHLEWIDGPPSLTFRYWTNIYKTGLGRITAGPGDGDTMGLGHYEDILDTNYVTLVGYYSGTNWVTVGGWPTLKAEPFKP